jgi:hypothetical protein
VCPKRGSPDKIRLKPWMRYTLIFSASFIWHWWPYVEQWWRLLSVDTKVALVLCVPVVGWIALEIGLSVNYLITGEW